MPNKILTLDWNDTFLSLAHLKSCFPDHKIELTTDDSTKQVPPFRLVHAVVKHLSFPAAKAGILIIYSFLYLHRLIFPKKQLCVLYIYIYIHIG